MTFLQISNLSHSFKNKTVLNKVNLSLSKGHILCLLGPSGCGKTTLLRIIAGLQQADEGSIFVNGKDFADVPTHKRNFGMMFQDLALFPHKNVHENIAFGLEIKKMGKKDIKTRVEELLKIVELDGYGNRSIETLSGGQCQRVALARSLAPSPQLLMLDEPLGSLDASLRERLLPDLHQILKTVDVTSIFVTHDHKEAFAIADKIAIIDEGIIKQAGSPMEIYQNPIDAKVANFLGLRNLIEGKVTGENKVTTCIGTFEINTFGSQDKNVTILIRPEAAIITEDNCNTISGKIKQFLFQGGYYKLTITAQNDQDLTFKMPLSTKQLNTGETVKLYLNPENINILGANCVLREISLALSNSR